MESENLFSEMLLGSGCFSRRAYIFSTQCWQRDVPLGPGAWLHVQAVKVQPPVLRLVGEHSEVREFLVNFWRSFFIED